MAISKDEKFMLEFSVTTEKIMSYSYKGYLMPLFMSQERPERVVTVDDPLELTEEELTWLPKVIQGIRRLGAATPHMPVLVYYTITPWTFKERGAISTVALNKNGELLPLHSLLKRGVPNKHLLQITGDALTKQVSTLPSIYSHARDQARDLSRDKEQATQHIAAVKSMLSGLPKPAPEVVAVVTRGGAAELATIKDLCDF